MKFIADQVGDIQMNTGKYQSGLLSEIRESVLGKRRDDFDHNKKHQESTPDGDYGFGGMEQVN